MHLSSNADLVVEQRRKKTNRRKQAEIYQNYFGHFLSQINIEVARGHQRSKLANCPELGDAVPGGDGRERGCMLAIFGFRSLNMEKEQYSQSYLNPGWCLRRETGGSRKE